MSGSSSDITLGTIGVDAGIPTLNVADVPANIRNGDSNAMKAYSEGLAFEDMLVSEMTQQLAKTMYGGDASGSATGSAGAGSGDTGDGSGSGGLLGGASVYASMIPQALTSSIMSGGGLGMAEQFAEELDPALRAQPGASSGASGQVAS